MICDYDGMIGKNERWAATTGSVWETRNGDACEKNNKSNKHGIWFEEAQTVFDDPHGRVFVDPEHSGEEERFITIGMSLAARLVVVIHCDRQSNSIIATSRRERQAGERPDFMKKEYSFSKLQEVKNRYAAKKKAVGINLSPEVIDYFKGLADKTGLPYQKLIDLFLLDCARKRKKPNLRVA